QTQKKARLQKKDKFDKRFHTLDKEGLKIIDHLLQDGTYYFLVQGNLWNDIKLECHDHEHLPHKSNFTTTMTTMTTTTTPSPSPSPPPPPSLSMRTTTTTTMASNPTEISVWCKHQHIQKSRLHDHYCRYLQEHSLDYVPSFFFFFFFYLFI
ncbi:merozoite surface protein 2, partial [Reticulomyxa filosa]